MASQQSLETSQKAGEMGGQAQVKKDEYAEKISQSLDRLASNSQPDQNSSITSQATNLLQQTGSQVKYVAQEAAEVVKNTLGMNSSEDNSNNNNSNNNNNNNTTDMKNPNNTTTPSVPGHPPSNT